MLGIRLGDGGNAPSLSKNLNLDGGLCRYPRQPPMNLRDELSEPPRRRRDSLDATMKTRKMTGMNI